MGASRDRARALDHRGYGPEVRELERITGIRYPNWDAPPAEHYKCFVAQIIALKLLEHDDIDTAKAEAMELFRRNSSYEKLRPYIELAISDQSE